LDAAIIFAHAYEQRNVSHNGALPQPTCSSSRSFAKVPTASNPPPSGCSLASSVVSVNGKPETTTIRLSLSEIAQRRKDGKCFNCDEFFTNGHKPLCKHLFLIEVISEDEAETGTTADNKPMISIHTLTGI
jgi:hypothetical protein